MLCIYDYRYVKHIRRGRRKPIPYYSEQYVGSISSIVILNFAAEVWETGESEAAMEEAVASILGERMKRMTAPPNMTSQTPELKQTLIISNEGSFKQEMEPVIHSPGENTSQLNVSMQAEGVEIPSTNLYVYDNASYLHKLMKDNTFGRRVRHDAPYTHRLGESEEHYFE